MCLFRYSQIPQTLTAAVSSRIDYRPLWLNQRREKLRAGNFVGLQKSSWSVKKKRRRKKMTKTVAVFQMDSQCRIRSTKACVSHLVPPCFWWILTHWWHFTEAESADASVLHLFTHDTKQNKGMPPAFFFSLCCAENPPTQTWKDCTLHTCSPSPPSSNHGHHSTSPVSNTMPFWRASARRFMDSSYSAEARCCSEGDSETASIVAPETRQLHTEPLWYLWE